MDKMKRFYELGLEPRECYEQHVVDWDNYIVVPLGNSIYSECRLCHNARTREYYKRNKEKIIAYRKAKAKLTPRVPKPKVVRPPKEPAPRKERDLEVMCRAGLHKFDEETTGWIRRADREQRYCKPCENEYKRFMRKHKGR